VRRAAAAAPLWLSMRLFCLVHVHAQRGCPCVCPDHLVCAPDTTPRPIHKLVRQLVRCNVACLRGRELTVLCLT
jgi:hypothetical protein